MIQLDKINKEYKDKLIFNDMSITFDHQITKIVGENGVGKSVLLKLIVGFSIPNHGSVIYDDKVLRVDTDFLENSGVSINAPQFMKSWSGFENLLYLSKIKNVCTREQLISLIEYFGLKEDIYKKYKTYSLGMQQKLRIIQALMDRPTYLILDEPFDGLDKKACIKVKEYLKMYLLEDSARMLIYTSHSDSDNDFAEVIYEICDQNISLIKKETPLSE